MENKISHPVRFWGLDPLFWIHRKMFVREILELKEHLDFKGMYHHCGHPVKRVEIMGHIVSVHEKEKLITYGVDDATGTISCSHWQQNNADDSRRVLSLGQLVTVQGKITMFRDKRELNVDLISAEDDINAEALFWLDVVHLSEKVYKQPFTLPEETQNFPDVHSVQSIQSVKTVEHLARHIKESLKEVKSTGFRRLCSQPAIQQLAKEILVSQTDTIKGDDLIKVRKIIREAMWTLEKGGFVFYKDAKYDTYEVISHEHHLRPAIINAIRQITQGSFGQGAHVARIKDVLHSTHKFKYVTRDQICNSLEKLVCTSDVYTQTEYIYCLVD